MSQQWLHAWFPVVALMLQVIFWSLYLQLHGSARTWALVTFSRLPDDPEF